MSRRTLSARTINKRIHRVLKEIELLGQQLDSLAELVPAPAEAEVEAMATGRQAITLESILVGVLYQAVFNLGEMYAALERYAPYTPAAIPRAEKSPWRSELLDFLRVAVRLRRRRRGGGANMASRSQCAARSTHLPG